MTSNQSSSAGGLVIDRVGRFWFGSDIPFDMERAGDVWVMLSNTGVDLYAVGRAMADAMAVWRRRSGTFWTTTSSATSRSSMYRE